MSLRSILHVDMDAFFAAIEQRDRPELMGQPVIVGADPKGGRGRGVVSTASYEARRFGIGSAMPISKAYHLCPKGVFLRVDMEKYERVSEDVMSVLQRFTDQVEPVSIDEAFLDVTGSRRALGTGESVARQLKEAIRRDLGLTASVGVAGSKLVAKIASDLKKPDGLVVVEPGSEAVFLAPLPIRKLWGVGPKMEERRLELGIATIGDLAATIPEVLGRRLGTHGQDLVQLARGIDDRPVLAELAEAKSLGQERTFGTDTDELARLRSTLLSLADGVAERLRSHRLRARTITLKYRDETFKTITRAETMGTPTDSGETVFRVAWRLFQAVHARRKVRLLGIYASGFGRDRQLDLFEPPPSPADQLKDAVAARFGGASITRATLLGRPPRRKAPRAPGKRGA